MAEDWDLGGLDDAQPCGCAPPVDLGAGFTVPHDAQCPRFWDHLRDAASIAETRAALAVLVALEPGRPGSADDMRLGLARRARELGMQDT